MTMFIFECIFIIIGKCCIDNKDSTPRRASNSRCKACWIKTCIEKLTVSTVIREQLMKYIPRLDAPPHNPLLTGEYYDIKFFVYEFVLSIHFILHMLTLVFRLKK